MHSPPDRRGAGGGGGCMYHDNTSPILHTVRSAHQRRVQVDGMHTPTLPSCTSEGARCLRGATPPCLAMRPRRDGMGRTPQRDARVREFAPNLPWPPNGRHGCGAADWTGTGNRGPCSQRGCWATSMSSHKHGRMPRCEQRRPSRAVRDGAFCQCTKSKSPGLTFTRRRLQACCSCRGCSPVPGSSPGPSSGARIERRRRRTRRASGHPPHVNQVTSKGPARRVRLRGWAGTRLAAPWASEARFARL